jgi:hypothetical protein
MDMLNIPYVDMEEEMTMYMAIGLICRAVFDTLVPYQMVHFLVEFKITNISISYNLSFDQEKQLLENLQNNESLAMSMIKKMISQSC